MENRLIVRKESIVTSVIDGEVVMMDMESGNYYGLGKIGSRIWDLLESPSSINLVCDILHQEFDVAREICEKDVADFLGQMEKKGIVLFAN
ncbi:lasso peptide biosynthesis PqqD family chaperone [Labilibaculum euxinus]